MKTKASLEVHQTGADAVATAVVMFDKREYATRKRRKT
jgi:hypothetical protein